MNQDARGGGCELMEIICPNGLKGGVRPGLGDSVIRLGLKAQRGRDTTGLYNANSPNKGKRNEKYKEKKMGTYEEENKQTKLF